MIKQLMLTTLQLASLERQHDDFLWLVGQEVFPTDPRLLCSLCVLAGRLAEALEELTLEAWRIQDLTNKLVFLRARAALLELQRAAVVGLDDGWGFGHLVAKLIQLWLVEWGQRQKWVQGHLKSSQRCSQRCS